MRPYLQENINVLRFHLSLLHVTLKKEVRLGKKRSKINSNNVHKKNHRRKLFDTHKKFI